MKQRALIILVAILGATCIVLGIFLLRGGKQPETADPTPEATATVTPTATPEAESSASTDSAVPYVSPIDFASLQKENPDIYACCTFRVRSLIFRSCSALGTMITT